MSKLANIKIFNIVVGKIFADLYAGFPVYTKINLSKYVSEIVSSDDFDGVWDVSEIAQASLDWLVDAGYLWVSDYQTIGEVHRKGVLTPKALEVLNSIPDSIDSSNTFGEELVEQSKSAVGAGISELVTQAISVGFRMMSNV